jgi:transposase
VRDCEWLADLLRHGLPKASFIPPLHVRELRELTRYRQTLVKEHTALANRIQKLIESANIKLGQVATDVLGASGRQMLRAPADGEEDVEVLAEMARSSLRTKSRNKALLSFFRLIAKHPAAVMPADVKRWQEAQAAAHRRQAG